MFVFGFRVKMNYQRNVDKKAQIKHLILAKRYVIQAEKLIEKHKIQNVHQQRSCALWNKRLQNQYEVE